MTLLAGWAAATGAEDLSGVCPQVPEGDPEAQKAIDLVVGLGGNNSWRGRHERDYVRDVLGPVVRRGLIDIDTAVGYAASGTPRSPRTARRTSGLRWRRPGSPGTRGR